MPYVQSQEEWEVEMSHKIIDYIKKELYMELRFMAPSLNRLLPKEKKGLKTFATDGITLWFSTSQLLRVFKSNSLFLDRAYLHTVLHCLFFHLWIRDERDKSFWNLACDIAVEYSIDHMEKKCTRRALSYIRKQVYSEIDKDRNSVSAANIYNLVMGVTGEEFNKLKKEFYTDDHSFWPDKESDNKSFIMNNGFDNWKKTARQTSLEKRKKSDRGDEGENLLNAQMKVVRGKGRYGDFLKKFAVMTEELKCDLDEFDLGTYSYGLRIYGNLPLIEPLETKEEKKIPEFAVAIDTSASTNGELVKGFLRETFSILSEERYFGKGCRVYILQCDDKIKKVDVIGSREELEGLLRDFTISGGGNTDFCPVFSYVEEERKKGRIRNLQGLLYFTDGMGIYPEKRPDYKTAFLFLKDYDEDRVPAWAIRRRFDLAGNRVWQ